MLISAIYDPPRAPCDILNVGATATWVFFLNEFFNGIIPRTRSLGLITGVH